MSAAQKVQLIRGNRDVAMDIVSLAVFGVMVFFVLNPEKYDRVTETVQGAINKVANTVEVWQTRLAIRSLPETENDE
jgi:TRAP-type C4-dicarboxylate transport system substrate-binding protein